MAAQLMATKGPPWREELRCRMRARPSLPTPGLAEEQHGQVAREERVHLGVEGAHGRGVAAHVAVGNDEARAPQARGHGGGGRGRTTPGGPAAAAGGRCAAVDRPPPRPARRRPGTSRVVLVACARERATQRGIARRGSAPARPSSPPREAPAVPKDVEAREVGHDPARGQRHESLPALCVNRHRPLRSRLADEVAERRRPGRLRGGRAEARQEGLDRAQAGSLQLVRRRRRGVVGGEAGGLERAVFQGDGQGRVVGLHRLDAQGHRDPRAPRRRGAGACAGCARRWPACRSCCPCPRAPGPRRPAPRGRADARRRGRAARWRCRSCCRCRCSPVASG